MEWMDLGCARAMLRMHKALSKRTHNEHVMENCKAKDGDL